MKVKPIPGARKNTLIKTIEKINIDVPPGFFHLHTTGVFVGSCNSGEPFLF